jgi:hypothetical protein
MRLTWPKIRPPQERPPVGFASVITTLLAPLFVGVFVGCWTTDGSPLVGLFYLLGLLTLMPHVLLSIFAVAFTAGKLMGIFGVRHVVFHVLGGVAVAWLCFLPLAASNSTPDDPNLISMMLPLAPRDGWFCFGAVGALNGMIYFWIARVRHRYQMAGASLGAAP